MFFDVFFSILLFLLVYVFIFINNKNIFFCFNFFFADISIIFILLISLIFFFFFEYYNFFSFYFFESHYCFNNYNFLKIFFFENISSNSYVISLFISSFFFILLILSKPMNILKNLLINIIFINLISLVFLFSNSIIIMFFSFELLLLISINLLKLTSKSERIMEAVIEMFMWTLFGSFFLLLGIFLNINFFFNNINYFDNSTFLSFFISMLYILGFGVKIPIWPCSSWLLKAHVEASVEFSILLSGFIVKLGVFGLIRFIDIFNNNLIVYIILFLGTVGIIDATIKLFSQQDLKKIVALTTIIEMNWLIICFVIGDIINIYLANLLIIAHSFSTTSEFLIVDCISKRYNTRDIWYIGSLWFNSPNIWYLSLAITFITIGFPGTSIFFIKFLFLSFVFNLSILFFLFFLFIFMLFIPIFFIKLWVPLWFGLYNNNPSLNSIEITKRELLIFFISISFSFLIGIYPNFFNFIII